MEKAPPAHPLKAKLSLQQASHFADQEEVNWAFLGLPPQTTRWILYDFHRMLAALYAQGWFFKIIMGLMIFVAIGTAVMAFRLYLTKVRIGPDIAEQKRVIADEQRRIQSRGPRPSA